VRQQIWGEVVDFNLAFFSVHLRMYCNSEKLLKSVHIYQNYWKKNLAQFFFWPTLYVCMCVYRSQAWTSMILLSCTRTRTTMSVSTSSRHSCHRSTTDNIRRPVSASGTTTRARERLSQTVSSTANPALVYVPTNSCYHFVASLPVTDWVLMKKTSCLEIQHQ